MNDESDESIEPMEEVPLIRLGESELERLVSAWLTERSRKLIPETRGSIVEGTICYTYREDDVDGRASMTKDAQRVLRRG